MVRNQLSVVIPCKDEESYLPALLDALGRQRDIDRIEYVCALSPDTKDGTEAIARRYGCRIVTGGRPATARNNGAQAATYDSILFMDADTYPEHELFLSKALAEFRDRGLHVAGTLLSSDYRGNGVRRLFYSGLYRFLRYEFTRRQDTANPLMQSAMFFDRTSFFDLGGFKEGIFREDSEIAARAVSSEWGFRFGILKNCGYLRNSVRRYEGRAVRALLKVGYLNAKAELFGYEALEDSIDSYLNGEL